MRAWVYHGNTDVRLEELPEPEPGPGEVAVRIAYNGICGSDLHEYFHGPIYIPIADAHPTTGHRGPVTLGHEASGVISALGDGVDGLQVGLRVALEPIVRVPGDDATYNLGAAFYGLMAAGFLADTAVVQRTAVHVLPDAVSLADGAVTEPLAVAWHAVARTDPRPGEAAVVFGGGPIGIGTSLSLRAAGVERLLVVEPSPDRRAVLEKLGFRTADPTAEDFRAALGAFAGSGVEIAVDAAGVPAAVTTGIDVLGPRGRLVIVAGHVAPVSIDTNQLLMAERSIVPSMAYRGDFPHVLASQADGAFPTDSWVQTVPFENLVDGGFEALAGGRAVKVLVEVGGG